MTTRNAISKLEEVKAILNDGKQMVTRKGVPYLLFREYKVSCCWVEKHQRFAVFIGHGTPANKRHALVETPAGTAMQIRELFKKIDKAKQSFPLSAPAVY